MKKSEKRISEEVDSLFQNMRHGKEVIYSKEYSNVGLFAVIAPKAPQEADVETIRQYSGTPEQIEADASSLMASNELWEKKPGIYAEAMQAHMSCKPTKSQARAKYVLRAQMKVPFEMGLPAPI